MSVVGKLSRHVFYPLWDIKERAERLAELRRLEKSQYWSRERLLELQVQRLRPIIRHAYESCDFYRELWDRAGVLPQIEALKDLKNFPIINKRDIRERSDQLLSRRYTRSQLFEARTGGSTGVALRILFDKKCQEFRNAAAMRSDRWAGRDLGTMTAALWGNPPVDRNIRDRIRTKLLNRMVYLDTMALNEESLGAFVEMWKRERPEVIYGHSHSIYVLGTLLRAKACSEIRPRGIISTSMMLLDSERTAIEEVFGCKVNNRYGCEEVGLIAAECPYRAGLHVNSEHVLVECLGADGTEVQTGEEGEVVVTDLINYGMPLIRYRVEDIAVMSNHSCVCGRGLPLLEKIVGRVADFLVKKDGTLVAGVSMVERTLTKIPSIQQMQIVQDTRDSIRINLVPGPEYNRAVEQELLKEFVDVFGSDVALDIVLADALDQTAAGKFRFAICNVQRPQD